MTAENWAYLSNDLIYGALFAFTISFIFYTYETAFAVKTSASERGTLDRTTTLRSHKIAIRIFFLATLLLASGVLARGFSASRVPWGNMYEFSITGALTFAIAFLVAGRKYDLRWLGLPISIFILLILGTAITLLYRPSAPLVPALRSIWLVVHVSAAIISGGVFLLSNTVAAAYLWLERMERIKGERIGWARRLPSLDVLDQLSYRLVAFVFPLWTFAVIAGAIWAEAAWGRYWGWDPKETWAFITWILYAAYLHARVTAGWKGRKAAWLCLLAGSTYLFNYVYINVWGTGRHTYSGL